MDEHYGQYVKPRLAKVLRAIGLDVRYERAQGDYMYYRDASGAERRVLDLLGGYGALLLGHNPPVVLDAARRMLDAGVPVHAQFSLRGKTGELARALNQIVRRDSRSDTDFVVTLANTGAEAIEAAIKHAELERVKKLERLLDAITLNIEHVRDAIRRGVVEIPPDLYESTDMREYVFDVRSFDDLIVALINHNSKEMARRPIFLALEKSFHGKLATSVQLTWNKNFRRAFQSLGLKTRFIAMNDAAALDRIAREEESELFDVGIVDGKVALIRRPWPQYAAFLLEPIQGEGGIHSVDVEFGRAIRAFCNQQDCPLIIDEIQSGMGRTGAFLASSQIGLRGDYYTLSKSLGGGLAKLSALLIRQDRYDTDFGLVHSSTFAEDDFSSGIALAVLEQLERDDGALYRQAAERGNALKRGLESLRDRYPDVIKDIRGRGLFLGLEFHPRDAAYSQILRTTDYADSLGYFIAGYLLRIEGIRIAPTGSSPNVLRFEPSVYLDDDAIARVVDALDRVCRILRAEDTLHLVFPLSSPERALPRNEIREFGRGHIEMPVAAAPIRPARKVAFINHLISPDWLRQVEPALAEMDDSELRRFVLNMAAVKKSAPYPAVRMRSPLGTAVDFILYPLCVASEQMGDWLVRADLEEIRDDIEERIESAREDGCEIAGLGMYTSIVTNNCTALTINEMGLTSGNALTVAMSLEALERAVADRGWDFAEMDVAIVGAAGNIASTYAAMLAEKTTRLTLIGSGRDGSRARIQKTVEAIYDAAWQSLLQSGTPPRGLVARLLEEPLVNEWLRQGAPRDAGRRLHEALVARHGHDPYIRIGTIDDIRRCQAVLCGANAPEPFLDAAVFAPDAVVCDVAVPHNVRAETLAGRPDVIYLQGGIVATPNGESLHPGARAYLGAGQIYACMAETAVLGLSGHRGNYSYGSITPQQVREIAALARLHGFGLADFKRGNSL
ncbi:aminotransferase class III-fold pyridoxal phosphate-dependent enzyme [Tahibacter amnicola]|uniref:Aminotransferase class III-fold pyridoxal phosphate-dependent enzyme n=1 Tax=Tahibacter amnicola TaxID=2976241 RepID=A0ABY6BHN5_9GAMM|nr:aminotransferase class III-fold pyridoxal phosphate-dependent enzyme [Tahibacter amnicola]UXI69106.1 aminotransferase class III-fold pyridoxal phosphate-dependent enzyme [Tahibacter amnicola]